MGDNSQGYKLLLSYDVKAESTQEYYRFVLGRYVPAMQSMGLEMSDAWHTAYGEFPNRLVGFVARDQETMRALLADDTWAELNEQLSEFVSDFSYKVIRYREGFQI